MKTMRIIVFALCAVGAVTNASMHNWPAVCYALLAMIQTAALLDREPSK